MHVKCCLKFEVFPKGAKDLNNAKVLAFSQPRRSRKGCQKPSGPFATIHLYKAAFTSTDLWTSEKFTLKVEKMILETHVNVQI